MKKIVSNTILTALAATNLTTIAAQSVSATTKADDSKGLWKLFSGFR